MNELCTSKTLSEHFEKVREATECEQVDEHTALSCWRLVVEPLEDDGCFAVLPEPRISEVSSEWVEGM